MRTVGIEEELLVVAQVDGSPRPGGHDLVDAAEQAATDPTVQFEREFKKEQAELGSIPSHSIDELRKNLQHLRSQMMSAAALSDSRVAALGTNPFKVRPTSSGGERYRRMGEEFGLVARQQLTCGQHVHVSISSRAEGVAVLDRIRLWLPLVTALSGNSPFWQGEDTGYASFRSMLWGQWPTAGPTEPFRDEAGYDAAVAELITSGAALDDGMVYFDARLSSHYPTVEIRVADVCTELEDALLIAALIRGLVETAATAWSAGEPVPEVRTALVRAAQWRASRFGMSGELIDPGQMDVGRVGLAPAGALPPGALRPGALVPGALVPAWSAVKIMMDRIRPALLRSGDLEFVDSALQRVRENGIGAEWQRRSFAQHGSSSDVVREAVSRTVLPEWDSGHR